MAAVAPKSLLREVRSSPHCGSVRDQTSVMRSPTALAVRPIPWHMSIHDRDCPHCAAICYIYSHLGPLSYVYGYRGGIGRRSSVEMAPATKLGHQSGDMSSLYGAAWPFLCPNRPFPRWADVGQRKNGRSVEKNLSAKRRAWAILGGMQSG